MYSLKYCVEFHMRCVDCWLTTRKRTCPVCKRDSKISDETTPLLVPVLDKHPSTPQNTSTPVTAAIDIPAIREEGCSSSSGPRMKSQETIPNENSSITPRGGEIVMTNSILNENAIPLTGESSKDKKALK